MVTSWPANPSYTLVKNKWYVKSALVKVSVNLFSIFKKQILSLYIGNLNSIVAVFNAF